jgi:hypothetical protein
MKDDTEELKGACIPPAPPPLLFAFILFTNIVNIMNYLSIFKIDEIKYIQIC